VRLPEDVYQAEIWVAEIWNVNSKGSGFFADPLTYDRSERDAFNHKPCWISGRLMNPFEGVAPWASQCQLMTLRFGRRLLVLRQPQQALIKRRREAVLCEPPQGDGTVTEHRFNGPCV
jgi:hypothetical protein